jgi:hypothetical protein
MDSLALCGPLSYRYAIATGTSACEFFYLFRTSLRGLGGVFVTRPL